MSNAEVRFRQRHYYIANQIDEEPIVQRRSHRSVLYHTLYLYKSVEPMALRPQIRAYFCSAIYAALAIVYFHGPRLLVTGLLQLAISASLFVLLLLLLAYGNEIHDLVVNAFSVCANLLCCLLPALQSRRVSQTIPILPSDPFRAILFQRPPPHIA
jgi:hypothetical protein